MGSSRDARLINDFLGSAKVFASSVEEVVEKRLLGKVAGSELTFSQIKLLKLVALTDARTIGDVAAFLGVSNAAASKAVDRLVRRKLLVRAEGEADRRAIQLSLNKRGRQVLGAYEAVKTRELAKVFGDFSREDLRRTAELLDRLSASIVDHTAKPDELCLQCGVYFRDKCLVRELLRRKCFYRLHKGRNSCPPTRRGDMPT